MALPDEGYIRLNYSAGYTDLKILSAKGLEDPERVAMFPPIKNEYLDGTMDNQFKGFRRKPLIYVGVVKSRTDRIGILNWYLDNDRTISYSYNGYAADDIPVVPSSTDGFESEWLGGISLARSYTFDLEETSIRSEWPDETLAG